MACSKKGFGQYLILQLGLCRVFTLLKNILLVGSLLK